MMLSYGKQHVTAKIAGVDVPHDLDVKGFESGAKEPRDDDFREDRISAARVVIKASLRRVAADQTKTRSNWVQCKVEQKLGYFLYPGELIVAMIAEGFKFKRSGRECLFNVDTGTLNNLCSRQPYYTHYR